MAETTGENLNMAVRHLLWERGQKAPPRKDTADGSVEEAAPRSSAGGRTGRRLRSLEPEEQLLAGRAGAG